MDKKKWVLRGKHKMGGYFYMMEPLTDGTVYDAESISSAWVFDDKRKADITCKKMNNVSKARGWRCYRVVSA